MTPSSKLSDLFLRPSLDLVKSLVLILQKTWTILKRSMLIPGKNFHFLKILVLKKLISNLLNLSTLSWRMHCLAKPMFKMLLIFMSNSLLNSPNFLIWLCSGNPIIIFHLDRIPFSVKSKQPQTHLGTTWWPNLMNLKDKNNNNNNNFFCKINFEKIK